MARSGEAGPSVSGGFLFPALLFREVAGTKGKAMVGILGILGFVVLVLIFGALYKMGDCISGSMILFLMVPALLVLAAVMYVSSGPLFPKGTERRSDSREFARNLWDSYRPSSVFA
jgi:hypothetical protein